MINTIDIVEVSQYNLCRQKAEQKRRFDRHIFNNIYPTHPAKDLFMQFLVFPELLFFPVSRKIQGRRTEYSPER